MIRPNRPGIFWIIILDDCVCMNRNKKEKNPIYVGSGVQFFKRTLARNITDRDKGKGRNYRMNLSIS